MKNENYQKILSIRFEDWNRFIESKDHRDKKILKMMQAHSFFRSEREALNAALALQKEGKGDYDKTVSVFVKVKKDGELYSYDDYWIVSDNPRFWMAIEHSGIELAYNSANIASYSYWNKSVEDIISESKQERGF